LSGGFWSDLRERVFFDEKPPSAFFERIWEKKLAWPQSGLLPAVEKPGP